MERSGKLANQARIYGWIWAAISPVLVGMALISTVESDFTYRVQLIAFGFVALVGLVSAAGVILKRVWGAKALLALSWLGCVYYFGAALIGLVFATIAAKASVILLLGLTAAIAAPGVAFLFLARGLARQLAAARGAV